MSFLPEAHIRPAFEKLTTGIVDHALQKLVHYIAKTWINNSTHTISTWNVLVYQREPTPMLKGCIVASTKRMQTSSPPFYQLVEKLFAEARLLPVHRKLVSEGKLSRFQRSVPRSNQSAIFSLWDQYTRKEITTKRLLHQCSSLNSSTLD